MAIKFNVGMTKLIPEMFHIIYGAQLHIFSVSFITKEVLHFNMLPSYDI